jgi:hypothetical protein
MVQHTGNAKSYQIMLFIAFSIRPCPGIALPAYADSSTTLDAQPRSAFFQFPLYPMKFELNTYPVDWCCSQVHLIRLLPHAFFVLSLLHKRLYWGMMVSGQTIDRLVAVRYPGVMGWIRLLLPLANTEHSIGSDRARCSVWDISAWWRPTAN